MTLLTEGTPHSAVVVAVFDNLPNPTSSMELEEWLMRLTYSMLGAAFISVSAPAFADIHVVPIDTSALAYGLSPRNHANSPANYDNSSANYDNSEANYDNSPLNYDNSASNYDNGSSSARRLLTSNNKIVGYYVFSEKGVMNIYNVAGRVAYMPSGGKTQSIFVSKGNEWCGTIGRIDGDTVIGMTTTCLLRLAAGR